MKLETANITERNIDFIAERFPNCITESADESGRTKKAINFELLKQMLSPDVVEGDEAYEFTWVGKKASIVEANKPIRKTLRPCPAESVDWDSTENLYIEGDNLEVLKLLQESYLGKVKTIFIDPPYNTGDDFIYPDSYVMDDEEYNEGTGYFDEEGNVNYSRKNKASAGKYHSDWCSMMYSRLMLAKNLLSDDGSIFVTIDYNEFENLKKIMDEVFGEANFQREIIWRIGWISGYKAAANNFIRNHDTILFYSKNASNLCFNKKYIDNADFKPLVKKTNEVSEKLSELGLNDEKQKELLDFINHDNRPDRYPIEDTWNCNEYDDLNSIAIVSYSGEKISKILDIDQDFKGQKSVKMLMRLIEATTEENDIVLDFFSGTASTAHAVMQMNATDKGNRRFIMVQLPELCDEDSAAKKAGYENICEIGKERIRRVGTKIKESVDDKFAPTFDTGFRVFKLDDSNMNDVYYAANDYTQNLLSGLESNVKPDRTDLDLLFGCLLDWGLPISMKYTSEQINGFKVHTYNDGDLIACFDDNISEDVVKEIAKRKPLRAVFRDSSFNGSPAKINMYEIFKLYNPCSDSEIEKRVRVI